MQLKKDYIPGYGDTVDLVIIAASWDKNRARELRGNIILLLFAMFKY
jgi:DNA ligase-4